LPYAVRSEQGRDESDITGDDDEEEDDDEDDVDRNATRNLPMH
jgi:hypothetical protein